MANPKPSSADQEHLSHQVLRVLMVEDSPDDAELIQLELTNAGYQIEAQRIVSGSEMTVALSGTDWDVIIADYGVPGFGAVPALNLLKKSARDIPFIIVSGSVSNELAVAAMRAGAHDYVLKENLARLAPAIEREIKERAARQRAKEENSQLQTQLAQAQKMEAIGRLAGGIAHDFNNLLMVIMAQTELLSLGLADTAAQQRAENVMKSARRAAELTGQLLAFSRKQTIQPTIRTLNQTVTGVSDMLNRLVGEDIDVEIALGEDPWSVRIDRSQFEQVIMNLVVNARDAMPAGGRLTLETANCVIGDEYQLSHPLVAPGTYAMLAVSDTGNGMTPEVKSRLFEPFFTTKEPGKGTGLGLSMVYGIVKQNNGFIWVYSELEEGTTFKIYLPKADVKSSANNEEPAPMPVQVSRGATVLLVEDDDALREVISEFLRAGGHKVMLAECLEEACRVAVERRNEIDVLLTDVVLKGGNGKQLVRKLEDQGCTFKVLYMSGYTPNAIVHHGVLDAETQFLQKPFSRATLLNKIKGMLD